MSSKLTIQRPIFSPDCFKVHKGTKDHMHAANGSLTMSGTPLTGDDLLAANKRICEVIKRIQVKNSPEYLSLKSGLRAHRKNGADILYSHLIHVKYEYRSKDNNNNVFVRAILCIVNCARRCFGYSSIPLNKYETIDVDAFKRVADEIIESLIDEYDHLAQFSIKVSKGAPKELRARNIKALEMRLKDSIGFSHGPNHFVLRFDPKKQRFNLNFYHSEQQVPWDQLSKSKTLYKKQRFEASVIDTKDHRKFGLPYETTFNRDWITSNTTIDYIKSRGLDLLPNRQYQILSPNGNSLSFEITTKS